MNWKYWLIAFVILSGIMIIGLKTGGKIMSNQILEQENLKGIQSMAGEELSATAIDYKNNNMTIEFKDRLTNIAFGEATLKSHSRYDEMLRVGIGENTVIWYDFYGFNNTKTNILGNVTFIDMNPTIYDEKNKKEILNPSYKLPKEKKYTLVYNDKGKWLPYISTSIPKENITIGVMTNLNFGEIIDTQLNIGGNNLDRHALAIGTSSGFVAVAPSADPGGIATSFDTRAMDTKDTSPATANRITEIGWWCDTISEEANYEVGLYSADGATVPGEAGTLIYSSTTNAKGTTAGWKTVAVDWSISASTAYWLAVQLDDTATTTDIDQAVSGGSGFDTILTQTSLPNPFGGGVLGDVDGMRAIYAKYDTYNKTFTTEQVESVSVTPLSNNMMVVAWCDEVANDATFQVFYTNGTNLTAPIDADADVSKCDTSSVSVSAFNSTAFVIGWYDGTDSDTTFRTYWSNGTAISNEIDADTDVNGFISYAVSVSAFNSTAFVMGWYDNTDLDITFRTYWSNGTAISNEIDADTDVSNVVQTVSVSAFNSTAFVIGWYSSFPDDDDIFRTYWSNGTAISNEIAVETNVGNIPKTVSVSALNSTAFVIGWYDGSDGDAIFRTYWSNGTAISLEIGADTTQGTGTSVSVSAQNSSQFVIGWFDQPDLDASFAVYNSAGTNLVAQTDSSTTALDYQAVASYSASTGIGFCNQNFVHAYAVSTTVADFRAYYANGSTWDGNCPAEAPSTCYGTSGKMIYVPAGCQYYIPAGTTGYT